MIIISQRAADRQTTVMNLLVGLGTRDGSCFWTSVSLPRDPLYSGFLKFPELPEMDKNAAYFGHSNAKTLSALGGEEGSGASPLTSRSVVLPMDPAGCSAPYPSALAMCPPYTGPHGL